MSKIPVVRLAPGVKFATLAPGGIRILAAIDAACQAMSRDLLITSGTDSHTTGRHVKGEAVDLAAHFLTPTQLLRLRTLLVQRLGERFTVLIESPSRDGVDAALVPFLYVNPDATGLHVHIQVKKDTEYPPSENVNV